MDDSAVSYGYTLAGEHAMRADKMRREAREMHETARQLEEAAEREEMRAQWAQELADALNPDTGEDGA